MWGCMLSDNLEIGSPWGNRNLAEVKFQIYILYNQDNKRERVSNLLLDVGARGSSVNKWALGSVLVQPWTPSTPWSSSSGNGCCPLLADLVQKKYKSSLRWHTDKYKNIARIAILK